MPHDRRFAVILDGSYSMNDHQSAIEQTFQWLTENILTQNSADLYLTTAAPAQPKRFDNLQDVANWQDAIFYGTLQPSEMLQQFQQLRGDTNYDAVLLVTDSGSYELSTDSQVSLSMPAPLWLVHLNELQFAYDDATIQAIQVSGGGISTDVEEVMQRLGTQPTKGNRTSLLNVVDGYAWYLTQVADPSIASPDGFEALAARQWVTHLSEYVKPDQMGELDTIHAVTKEYGIVSPYSSMIVLVNDQQREALKQAEQSDDRFNREIEDQQGLPQATSISAVPEPAEWLLLLVGLFMLWFIYQRQRSSESDRLIEPEL
ncbi:MAG: TIGR02921 family PEP-CTERM protein [Cyanobacteria bacterium CRU_2_1]|nr:TIGR02921 family PEP-CTERM protein [Cyanobacteria bacterium CRU_2_1]